MNTIPQVELSFYAPVTRTTTATVSPQTPNDWMWIQVTIDRLNAELREKALKEGK